jgi:hypothetical protein
MYATSRRLGFLRETMHRLFDLLSTATVRALVRSSNEEAKTTWQRKK